MRILIVGTGRGAELCILTSFVARYRIMYPDAEISVGSGPQWKALFDGNPAINAWVPVSDGLMELEHARADGFEIAENVSQNSGEGESLLDCMYNAIKDKRFTKESVPRGVFMYPSEKDITAAKRITKEHPGLILVSHACTSSKNALTPEGWAQLADRLGKYGPVVYTGSANDPKLPNVVDLRGMSYGCMQQVAMSARCFVGLDTATTWVCAGMPSRIVTLRSDPLFPLTITGMVKMGYRRPDNTKELVVEGMNQDDIIQVAENTVAA